MDTLLSDELLQEIFHRVPPPFLSAVSLVCKRWCRLLRSSTTSLSLHFPPPYNPTTVASFSAFLNQHPFLSSISFTGSEGGDPLLIAVASSCPNLRHLRFVSSQVSPVSLYPLSASCLHLTSIAITIARPLSFHWLPYFNSLNCLSVTITNPSSECNNHEPEEIMDDAFNVGLSLETLSLRGILPGDLGLSFLWRNCKKIKKLELKNCESLGDYSGFVKLLGSLQELELRTCRSIVDSVLLKLAENCVSLNSLLVYDGGSGDALLHFINRSKCSLRRLDLRLPLDLDNTHLIALSENLNFRGLVSLRLQSCCLVTGEGLKALGRAVENVLEELALINCDVIGREPGLLMALGQNFRRLRKLDLSYNDMLVDKELVSMFASSNCLVELKLRGCNRLTNKTVGSVVRNCKQLQHVDLTYCRGIRVEGDEFFVVNSQRLRRVEVEQGKVANFLSLPRVGR